MESLPFTYNFENSTHVQKLTIEFLDKNKDLSKHLSELSWAFHSIGMIIPQTTENWLSGHYFPFSESFEEFQVSFLLCSQGFYKQSMMSLRSVLETGLLSVYYNINDEGHETVQGWLQSEDGKENDTPFFNKIWKILLAHPNISKFQNEYDIKTDLLKLEYLHNYVHSKGAKYSNQIGLIGTNTQTFEKLGFDLWLESATEIVKMILILHLLKFPLGIIDYDYSRKFGIDIPTFGGLNSFHIARIKSILGEEISECLLNIALEDKTVVDFIKQIENMPDITQAEIEKQVEIINRIFDNGTL